MNDREMKDLLCREGNRYSFIQAVRLLRTVLEASCGTETDLWERIRVRPDLSLSFPETDLTAIEERDGRFLITATFLGLYGASSPLPAFYTEDLLDEQSMDNSISRDFLDIVNSRLYSLFFECWAHYKLFFKVTEKPEKASIDRLYCLLGLGSESLQNSMEDSLEMVRYAGLLTQYPRSAESLRCILSDAIGEKKIRVEQCVPRLVEIPGDQLFLLGDSGNRLGEDAYIGEEFPDCTGKIRISIGPVGPERLGTYFPDRELYDRIGRIVKFYLDQPVVWDLEVLVSEAGSTMQLGSPGSGRLGWNTWTYSAEYYSGVKSVIFPETN